MSRDIRKQRKQRLPYVLLILVIVFSISIVGIAISLLQNETQINNLVITNISSNSFTLTWTTKEPSKSQVLINENDDWNILTSRYNNDSYYDDRDINLSDTGEYELKDNSPKLRTTHHVTIRDLEPSTSYYFRIVDGIRLIEPLVDNVITSEVPEDIKTPEIVYGTVENQNLFGNITEGIVYYSLYNDSQEESNNEDILQDHTLIYSTTLNDSNGWAGDISMMKTYSENFAEIDSENDKLRIQVRTNIGSTERVLDINNSQPFPPLQLVGDRAKSESSYNYHYQKQNALKNSLFMTAKANAGYWYVECHDNLVHIEPNGQADFIAVWGITEGFNQWIGEACANTNISGRTTPSTPRCFDRQAGATCNNGGNQVTLRPNDIHTIYGCSSSRPSVCTLEPGEGYWTGGTGCRNACFIENGEFCGYHSTNQPNGCISFFGVSIPPSTQTTPQPTAIPTSTPVPNQEPANPVGACGNGYCRIPGADYIYNSLSLSRTYFSNDPQAANNTSTNNCCSADADFKWYCDTDGTWKKLNNTDPSCTPNSAQPSVPPTITQPPVIIPPTLAPTVEPVVDEYIDYRTSGLIFPAQDGFVSTEAYNFTGTHPALDIASRDPSNTNATRVLAAAPGEITKIRTTDNYNQTNLEAGCQTQQCVDYDRAFAWTVGMGKMIIIKHNDNTRTIYAHLSQIANLSVGQQVSAGEYLGQMGQTGFVVSNGPILHFELRTEAHFVPDGQPNPGRCDNGLWAGCFEHAIDPRPFFRKTSHVAVPASQSSGSLKNNFNFLDKLYAQEPIPADSLREYHDFINNPNQSQFYLSPGFYNLSSSSDSYQLNVERVLIPNEYENGLQILFFEDLNRDNIWQPETESLIEEDVINVEINQTAEVFSYKFDFGWNSVAFPFVSEEIETASKLISYLKSRGIQAIKVARIEGGRLVPYVEREDGSTYNNDFPIIPGNGYMIQSMTRGNSISLTGNAITNNIPNKLQNGWNLIGLVSNNSYTAESYIDKCISDNIICDSVALYNNGLYSELIVKEDGVLFGNDFNLNQRQSYFVRVNSGGNKNLSP